MLFSALRPLQSRVSVTRSDTIVTQLFRVSVTSRDTIRTSPHRTANRTEHGQNQDFPICPIRAPRSILGLDCVTTPDETTSAFLHVRIVSLAAGTQSWTDVSAGQRLFSSRNGRLALCPAHFSRRVLSVRLRIRHNFLLAYIPSNSKMRTCSFLYYVIPREELLITHAC